MAVDSGMDVERVRSIAQQLMSQGDKIGSVAGSGRAQIGVLDGVWAGPDLENFSGRWGGAERAAHNASTTLRTFGERMMQQADDQQEASDGIGGGSGGGTGGGGGGRGDGGGSGGGRGIWDTIMDAKFWGGMGAKVWTLLTKPGVVMAALRYKSLLSAMKAADGLQDWMKASWLFNQNAYTMFKGLVPGSGIMQRLAAPASYLDELGKSTRLGQVLSKFPWAKGASLAGNALSKVFGPLGVVTGALDIYNGIKDGDYLKAFGGAAGLTSGALTTAIAFGVIAGGPVTIGIAAGAAIIAGGIAIYQNWDAISEGAGKAWDATKDFVGGVTDKVGSVISDPIGSLGSLF